MVGEVLVGLGLELRDMLHPPPEDELLPSQRASPAGGGAQPPVRLPVQAAVAAEKPGETSTC